MKHMAQKGNYKKKRFGRRAWIGIVVAIAILVMAGAYYKYVYAKEDAKTTSTAKTAQNDYSDGKPRETDGQSTGNSQGGAKDNNGETPGDTPPAAGNTTSPSGVITVTGLTKDSLLKSGSALSGTVTGEVKEVQFRVLDDEVGVIAQGALKVVDGAFSGTLYFNPKSSVGRVDVFNFDAVGVETNNTEIPVRFK